MDINKTGPSHRGFSSVRGRSSYLCVLLLFLRLTSTVMGFQRLPGWSQRCCSCLLPPSSTNLQQKAQPPAHTGRGDAHVIGGRGTKPLQLEELQVKVWLPMSPKEEKIKEKEVKMSSFQKSLTSWRYLLSASRVSKNTAYHPNVHTFIDFLCYFITRRASGDPRRKK